ncbi:MAG TPA: lipid-binding SYLF domain-containing protein [Tepidisphaeraceae bacterium]|jgi:lipid-binding SYLF domain-containing protein
MKSTLFGALLLAGLAFGLVGCSAEPKNEEKKNALDSDVQASLDSMRKEDPSFASFVDKSYGYAVYPSVGKGGLIVGGAYGHGEVFEQGRMIGYSDLTAATVGAQIGGQSFTEVICFENKAALDNFISKEYAFSAGFSAVALKSGAAAQARFKDGIAVFTYVKGGLMAEASVGGQKFRFVPLANATQK